MTISERTEVFFDRSVQDYQGGPVATATGVVHRLSLDYDDTRSMAELLDEYLSHVDTTAVDALILGMWSEPHDQGPGDALDLLVRRAGELPALKALFVGDMTYEDCEISWIIQGNYAPLLQAYPGLEVLQIRGATSLELPPLNHGHLRRLVIESGGLPRDILNNLAASTLPALEHLELWLGTEEYGFDADLADCQRTVQALRSPRLRYLGLRDSEIADEIAQWLAGEAWVAGLHTLDLSLGTLGDDGARALLGSPHLAGLQRLDLSHHYISQELQAQLRAALPAVVLDDAQDPDDEDDRYVAVGE